MASRVGLEVVLDLGDVALEPRAQREQAGHLLAEELGRVRLGAVDPAEPRTTIARMLGDRSQAASSCREPITLMSCIAREDMPGPGCLDDLVVHDRVDLELRDELRYHRVADIGVDHLGSLEIDLRRARVEPGHALEGGVALEPSGEPAADVAAHAGDQHPATRRPASLAPDCEWGPPARRRALGAGSRCSIASSRRADRPQLGLQLADVLVGTRRVSITSATAFRLRAIRCSASRRVVDGLDEIVDGALGGLAAALGRAERGLDGALHGLAQRIREPLAGARLAPGTKVPRLARRSARRSRRDARVASRGLPGRVEIRRGGRSCYASPTVRRSCARGTGSSLGPIDPRSAARSRRISSTRSSIASSRASAPPAERLARRSSSRSESPRSPPDAGTASAAAA